MTTIKKDYVALVQFLEDNKTKKVSTILEEVKSMCSKKSNDKTYKTNDKGEVTHVFCYYHKVWEDVSECEYGPKKHTSSGLNTMCKEGVSNWTKQQRIAKKAKEELLTKLSSGEMSIDDLPKAEIDIETERTKIVPRADVVEIREKACLSTDNPAF